MHTLSMMEKFDSTIPYSNITYDKFTDFVEQFLETALTSDGKPRYIKNPNDNWYFNMCVYDKSDIRKKEHITHQSGLVVDYDDNVSSNDIKERLCEYTYLMYPSPRWRYDGKTEKFRVVLPFGEHVGFPEIEKRINSFKKFFTDSDASSFSRGQIQGMPRQLDSNRFTWWSHMNTGKYFNPLLLASESSNTTRVLGVNSDNNQGKTRVLGVNSDNNCGLEEVKEWLSYIDKALPRNERYPINGAVINQFGSKGVDVMVQFWQYKTHTIEGERYEYSKPGCFDKAASDCGLLRQKAIDKGWKPQHVIEEYAHMNKNKTPKFTIENLKVLLHNKNITCRYNQMTKTKTVFVPGCSPEVLSNPNNCVTLVKNEMIKEDMACKGVSQSLDVIAATESFHPVLEWYQNTQWDGEHRFKQLCDLVVVTEENKNLRDLYLTRWLMSAVHALHSPQGYSQQHVLLFDGPQGIGKSSWFERLLPFSLNAIKTGCMLNPSVKDDVLNAIRFFIVELGEIDAVFRKADISAMKACLTERVDTWRVPYGELPISYPRQTIFCGSVNEREFLSDTTGNRRYLVLEVIDFIRDVDIDVLQLWAELENMYQNKIPYQMTADELHLVNENNREFEQVSPIGDKIAMMFTPCNKGKGVFVNATEILGLLGYEKPTKKEKTDCAAALRQQGFKQTKIWIGKEIQKKGYNIVHNIN